MLRLPMGPKLSYIAPPATALGPGEVALEPTLSERAAALLVELRDVMADALDDGATASGLSRTELDALRALASSGPMRVGELRRFVPGAQSTTSELVARLEKRGLARREVDPFDARATRVVIRPRGHRLLDDRARGNPRACDDVLVALDDAERMRFVDALGVVVSLAKRAETASTFHRAVEMPSGGPSTRSTETEERPHEAIPRPDDA